ncbi:MAG: hypothetical protein HQM08_24715 [Candidatus Riflebacteria bacterium]|nr:hypothetical protein [Candidatus Riflebacteria bacterium]
MSLLSKFVRVIFLTTFLFTEVVFAQIAVPFNESSNVTIAATAPSKIPEGSVSLKDILTKAGSSYQIWRWNDHDQILLDGAKKLASTTEIITLSKEAHSKEIRDKILLSGINTPKTFNDIVAMIGVTDNSKVIDQIIQTNCDKCTRFQMTRLADMTKAYIPQDETLSKALKKTTDFEQALDCANRMHYQDTTNKALLEVMKKAEFYFDYLILAGKATEPVKSQILLEGLKHCKTFDEIIDLGVRTTDQNILDKIVEKAIPLAKSSSDLKILSSWTKNTDLLKKIAETKLPETDPSQYNRLKLLKSLREKYGINIYDDGKARWTNEQLVWLDETLQTLPKHIIDAPSDILPAVSDNAFLLGDTRSEKFYNQATKKIETTTPVVRIYESGMRNEKTFKEYLVHEMTHAYISNKDGILNNWVHKFWPDAQPMITSAVTVSWVGTAPNPPSVSDYGNVSPSEDLAESARMFWVDPVTMKQNYPDRYDFVYKYIFGKEYNPPKLHSQ